MINNNFIITRRLFSVMIMRSGSDAHLLFQGARVVEGTMNLDCR